MNSEEEILDRPEDSKSVQQKFKSRVPSDLMIILGILHILIACYAFYLFAYTFYLVQRSTLLSEESSVFLSLMKNFTLQSLPLLFGIVLVFGGVGLLRHKRVGWVFALSAAIFSILLPILKIAMLLYLPGIVWSVSDVFGFLFLLFFGLSFAFLISKTIRTFYAPEIKDYYRVGIIALILALNFLLTPLLYLT